MNESSRQPRNLIFGAFAWDNAMQSSLNVRRVRDKAEMYYKNAVVALASAKEHNPACDVALVTNADVPSPYKEQLEQRGILIIPCPFDAFRFDAEYPWGLAFYKLCAIRYLLEMPGGYNAYLMFDLDTYTQRDMDCLWPEAENNLLLLPDCNQRPDEPNNARFNQEISSFTGTDRVITHYGGFFLAGSAALMRRYIDACAALFARMQSEGFLTHYGDEFITSIALDGMRDLVKDAGAYTQIFWTGTFRLMSTFYKFYPVAVLHVPAEKASGMLRVYRHYARGLSARPLREARVHRMLHLRHMSVSTVLKKIMKTVLGMRM